MAHQVCYIVHTVFVVGGFIGLTLIMFYGFRSVSGKVKKSGQEICKSINRLIEAHKEVKLFYEKVYEATKKGV